MERQSTIVWFLGAVGKLLGENKLSLENKIV